MHSPKKQLITIDEILNGSMIAKRFNGTFLDDSSVMFKDENKNLVLGQIKDNLLKTEILLLNQTFVSKLSFSIAISLFLFKRSNRRF
jgi:hypothetical protein